LNDAVGNVKPGLEVAGLTEVGLRREDNEDAYLYWEPEGEEECRRKGRLAVVADGMGGYEGGQEASRLAVETVRDVYNQNFRDDPQAALLESFVAAHERILSYAAEHHEFNGMGTTCTALAVVGRRLYFAHVGDSRLYLVHDSKLTRLTRDHSYVGRLVESGIVRSEDAEHHPQRHILTAALGSGTEIAADVPHEPALLSQGDTLVLCTDGLWALVSEPELLKAMEYDCLADSCAALVRIALQRGGPDNITVQILRFNAPL
jgi:PPM family protein phosphatase